MPSEIQAMLDTVKSYLPSADLTRIEEAYQFAKTAHTGQLRFSGEPYINHPVAATKNLLSLQPDEDTIVACLLHDVVEDTETDIAVIEKKFGKSVALLVSDMEKLGKIRFQGAERQVENLRKMFVSMARDLRVIFIKLADRLHNMETLEHVRPDKQKRIAKETLEVYAPIAARLGIYPFKSQLEDLAFQCLEPDNYAKINQELAGTAEGRKKFVESAAKSLAKILKEAGLSVKVSGRTKHVYSIWRKLQKKGYANIQEIYDLYALRVLVKEPAECYTALGAIHHKLTPLSNRFKDFIAVPKINGYQSLHTTVLGLKNGQPTEIQIRTFKMHEEAERGAAAHWQYSEKKKSVKVDQQRLNWVKNLVDLHDRLQNNEEFVETLTVDALTDRIFVLTPTGDVLDLPAGATPIDFAYTVHTEIGHTTAGAKVNGRIVPLEYTLKNGEVIEVLTKKNGKPNRFWLSFAKTDGARSKIKAYFNALDRTENITAGKELLNKHLARLGKTKLDAEFSILKNYKKGNLGVREREGLLERIGNGSVNVGAVVRDLFDIQELAARGATKRSPVAATSGSKQGSDKKEVIVAGESGLLTTFAKCCKPKPREKIVALMSQKKGASIHKANCKMLAKSDPERKLAAAWQGESPVCQFIRMAIGGENRVGFLRDIATEIADIGVNIADITLRKDDKHEILHELTVEICGMDQLGTLLERLEKIKGVTTVKRL